MRSTVSLQITQDQFQIIMRALAYAAGAMSDAGNISGANVMRETYNAIGPEGWDHRNPPLEKPRVCPVCEDSACETKSEHCGRS